jgi:uncharacterized iron-regulated membrane protein
MSRPAERPRRGLWRTEIVRAVLSGHSILGIAFAAMIYIVCLTGSLCVFMRDFQRWEQPDAPVVYQVSDVALARAMGEMAGKLTPGKAFFVSLPDATSPRLQLSSGDDDDDQTWLADASGRLVAEQRSPWTSFVVDLHTQLHLPDAWGRFVVGLAGVALLSSLISGVLAHPRIFRDAFHLRLGGSRRLEQADLHNRLGVWPLPFHVLISLTGALLGLSTLIVGVLALLIFRGDTSKVYGLLNTPPPAVDTRAAPPPDIDRLLVVAHGHLPDAQIRQLNIFNWGRRDFYADISAARPRLIGRQDSVSLAANGKVLGEKHAGRLTIGEQILSAIGQLHFGWFGGVAIRIVYGLLGLALCVVTATGITVWLARRRDKGRAAPTLERLWASISWGQPLILAVTASIALILPGVSGAMLTTAWAFLTVFLAVGTAAFSAKSGRWIAAKSTAATGLLLIFLGLASTALHWSRMTDPAAVLVSLLLAAGGMGLVRYSEAWRGHHL